MTTQELKKYLFMVVDMETSIYMQEQLMKQLEETKKRLCIRDEITKPVMPSQPEKKPTGCGVSLVSLIAAVALFRYVCTLEEGGGGKLFLSIVLFIVAIAAFVIGSDGRESNRSSAKNYQNEMQRYEKNLISYNKQISDQEKRIVRETPKKLAIEMQQRQVQREIIQSRNVLDKLYSYNIIYPKYRKLEYVCSLYEYLCAGRCTTLEVNTSEKGGYNILEEEMLIISQVDRIVNSLESIKYSQRQLYNAVMDSNQQLSRIIASTDRMADQVSYLGNQTSAINSRLSDLQRSSELTAYYNERNNKHLEYMNWMNYHSGVYNNTGFYNRPPLD